MNKLIWLLVLGEVLKKILLLRYLKPLLQNLNVAKKPLRYSDFRLLDNSIIKKINNLNFEPPFLRHYLDSLNFKSKFIDIDIPERIVGSSKFTLIKLILLGLERFIFLRIGYFKFFIIYFFCALITFTIGKSMLFHFLNLTFLLIFFLKIKSFFKSRKVTYNAFIRNDQE